MIVIGVDPGTHVTGYGVVSEERGLMSCHYWGVVTTRPRDQMYLRLRQIADGLRQVIREYSPDCLALEESFFAKDPKAALKLGQARGAIMLVAAEEGLLFDEYSPLKIKETVTGYGRAEKTQVQLMVRNLLRLDESPTPLDASDALAVAITHLTLSKIKRL